MGKTEVAETNEVKGKGKAKAKGAPKPRKNRGRTANRRRERFLRKCAAKLAKLENNGITRECLGYEAKLKAMENIRESIRKSTQAREAEVRRVVRK